MQWVAQDDPYGCGVACVAMVADKTYADVKALVGRGWTGQNDGLTYYELFDLLSQLGFAVRGLRHTMEARNRPERLWPPDPFSDVHIVLVDGFESGHFVVWCRDGRVLDPARPGVYGLQDYEHVAQVLGVYRAESLTAAAAKKFFEAPGYVLPGQLS